MKPKIEESLSCKNCSQFTAACWNNQRFTNVFCSICTCLNVEKMAVAQRRKSHHHRSELKHLFISRAPPLNQTEPDPGHWPPDRDYNVVRVRTGGPSCTLLGVYPQTATSATTRWFVPAPVLLRETEPVGSSLPFVSSKRWKLMEASGKPAVLNKKKEPFMHFKWGEDAQLSCLRL